MENYCNNCGNFGHLYKDCRHPILSYGIILYHKEKTELGKFIYRIIMVERKDSLSYIEFLRGKYKTPLNHEYIQLLISRMTEEETRKSADPPGRPLHGLPQLRRGLPEDARGARRGGRPATAARPRVGGRP